MAKLGPVQFPECTSNSECDQEYSHALGNLITEISLSGFQELCSGDVHGEKRKIASILNHIQNALQKIFQPMFLPSHHDLHEFDYWTVLPLQCLWE